MSQAATHRSRVRFDVRALRGARPAPFPGCAVQVSGCSTPARCAAATPKRWRDLRERLDPFIRKGSPLSEPIKKPKATWVEPVMEAEIGYGTLTENALLREAVFKGLREGREVPTARKPGGRVPNALAMKEPSRS